MGWHSATAQARCPLSPYAPHLAHEQRHSKLESMPQEKYCLFTWAACSAAALGSRQGSGAALCWGLPPPAMPMGFIKCVEGTAEAGSVKHPSPFRAARGKGKHFPSHQEQQQRKMPRPSCTTHHSRNSTTSPTPHTSSPSHANTKLQAALHKPLAKASHSHKPLAKASHLHKPLAKSSHSHKPLAEILSLNEHLC